MSTSLRVLAILTMMILLPACGNGDDAGNGSDNSTGTATETSSGDTSSAPSSDLLGKMLDEMESLNAVLKDVKDQASAEAAAEYIDGYAERHKALADQYAALSPAEQLAMGQKHVQRSMTVQTALQQEMMRIGLDPELRVHFSDAFKKLKSP